MLMPGRVELYNVVCSDAQTFSNAEVIYVSSQRDLQCLYASLGL